MIEGPSRILLISYCSILIRKAVRNVENCIPTIFISRSFFSDFSMQNKQMLFDPNLTKWHARQHAYKPLQESLYQEKSPIGNLQNMQHPQHMDASTLGMYACIASKVINNELFWKLIIERAKELLYSLEPKDIALILNALSRIRNFDVELFNSLIPIISNKLIYYKSTYFAMVISAYAKGNIYNEKFFTNILKELRNRYYEFQSPIELSMIMNALARLQVYDEGIFNIFAAHIKNRMCLEPFHIRELAVIVYAYAKVNHADNQLFDLVAEKCLGTLSEGTPLEFSRIFHAFAKVRRNASFLFEVSSNLIKEKILFMSPNEIIQTAFAFGSIKEVHCEHIPLLDTIVEHIRFSAMSCLSLFTLQEITSFLQTYARWKIVFEANDLLVVMDHLLKHNLNKACPEILIRNVYSLAVLVKNNAEELIDTSSSSCLPNYLPGLSSPLLCATQTFFLKVLDKITTYHINSIGIFQLTRLVESFALCRINSEQLLSALRYNILKRIKELDAYSASVLFEHFKILGCDKDDDLLLMLEEYISKNDHPRKLGNAESK